MKFTKCNVCGREYASAFCPNRCGMDEPVQEAVSEPAVKPLPVVSVVEPKIDPVEEGKKEFEREFLLVPDSNQGNAPMTLKKDIAIEEDVPKIKIPGKPKKSMLIKAPDTSVTIEPRSHIRMYTSYELTKLMGMNFQSVRNEKNCIRHEGRYILHKDIIEFYKMYINEE